MGTASDSLRHRNSTVFYLVLEMAVFLRVSRLFVLQAKVAYGLAFQYLQSGQHRSPNMEQYSSLCWLRTSHPRPPLSGTH